VVFHGPAEAVGDPVGDGLSEFGRRELDVRAGVVVGVDLADERLAVAVGFAVGDVRLGDLDGFGGFRVGRRAPLRADLDEAGIRAAGDTATPVADLLGDPDRDDQLLVEPRPANDARKGAVHADRGLVDVFGFDAPLDVLGVDVDRQGVGDGVNRDVGVILRADIHPAVAAVDRPTPAADGDLHAVGRVDEIEGVEVAAVTEGVAVGTWRAGPWLATLGDLVATLRTES